MNQPTGFGVCPVAVSPTSPRITLAHGEGARLTRRLIDETILPRLGAAADGHGLNDAACLAVDGKRLAFTTDSFVVSPLFFPGGDIGRLAVFGTVNDLAVSGAEPLVLSLSLILEEGLPLIVLEQVLDSVREAAQEARVRIVTGDTKVVPCGAVDGLFINTSGIGQVLGPTLSGPSSIQEGDAVLLTGPIGRHGLAVLAAREQLNLQPPFESDCGSLWPLVRDLSATGLLTHVRAMRDATRGGLAAVLHEWSAMCRQTFHLEEARLPIPPDVRGASELLGLDPLHIANEGAMVLVVDSNVATAIEAKLREHAIGSHACRIGDIQPLGPSPVVAHGPGAPRAIDEPTGTLLPRIC